MVILGVEAEVVLVDCITGNVMGQREYFQRDIISIPTIGDELPRFFKVMGAFAVEPRSVFHANILTLLIHAVWVNDLKEVMHEYDD